MAEIIDIRDGGLQKYRTRNVGVIIFKIITNESKPEELIGYCDPNYRDSIIKNLRRLNFHKLKAEDNDAGRETGP